MPLVLFSALAQLSGSHLGYSACQCQQTCFAGNGCFKPGGKQTEKAIVGVKGGTNVSFPMIRDLAHVVDREQEKSVVFVTLAPVRTASWQCAPRRFAPRRSACMRSVLFRLLPLSLPLEGLPNRGLPAKGGLRGDLPA
jgi:hypothetical protein